MGLCASQSSILYPHLLAEPKCNIKTPFSQDELMNFKIPSRCINRRRGEASSPDGPPLIYARPLGYWDFSYLTSARWAPFDFGVYPKLISRSHRLEDGLLIAFKRDRSGFKGTVQKWNISGFWINCTRRISVRLFLTFVGVTKYSLN